MSDQPLRVFTVVNHSGYWPVGTASVIVSYNELHARHLLDTKLRSMKLRPDDYKIEELDLFIPFAKILCDGDY